MRRQMAVFTDRDDLLYYTWVDESEVESFCAKMREYGLRPVDVEGMARFSRPDLHNQRNPTDRLGHLLPKWRNQWR
jgi:hypothetical protein